MESNNISHLTYIPTFQEVKQTQPKPPKKARVRKPKNPVLKSLLKGPQPTTKSKKQPTKQMTSSPGKNFAFKEPSGTYINNDNSTLILRPNPPSGVFNTHSNVQLIDPTKSESLSHCDSSGSTIRMFPNQQGHPSSYSGGPVTQANMAAYHHQQQQGMQPSPLYPGGGTPGYGIPPNGYMSGNGPFQGGQRISSNIQHINSMNNPGACNYGPGTSGPPTTLHQQQMMNGGQQRIGWESEGRPGHSQFYNGMGQMTVQQQQAAHQQSFIQQQQQQNSNQMILQQQQMHHANALQHQQVQKNMSASLKRKNSGQNVAERAPKQFMGSMVNTANSVPFSQQNPGYGVINGGPSPMYQQTSHEMPSSNFPVNNQQMQQQQVLNNQMVKKEYMATPNPSPYNGNFENQNSQQQWGVKRPPSQNEQMRAEVRNNLQAKQHMNTNNLPLVRPPPTPPSQGSVFSNSSPQNGQPLSNNCQVGVYPSPSSVGSGGDAGHLQHQSISAGQEILKKEAIHKSLRSKSPISLFENCSYSSNSIDFNLSLTDLEIEDFKLFNGDFDLENPKSLLRAQQFIINR